jgi:hypothetical protein
MAPIRATQTIVEPDIAGCPVGFLFRGREANWDREERYFPSMEAPLNHPNWATETYLYIIEDEEGKCLEQIAKSESTILTRNRELADYQVAVEVRQFIAGAMPNMDDEYCTVARNGIVFRQQDLRRYYQFCLEGYERVVLYKRWDYDREVLAETNLSIDPTRYYRLLVEVQGKTIRCYCDGELVGEVEDDTYAGGAAGIRQNSICRYRNLRIATWDTGDKVYTTRLQAKKEQLMDVRQAVPRPVLWRQYDMPELRQGRVHFYKPQEDRPVRLLIAVGSGDYMGYSLYDLEGELLWRAKAEKEGPGEFKLADMDGDGIKEIIGFFDGGIAIHSSVDGRQLAWGPWPESGPYDRNRTRATITRLYPADLHGTGYCDSVVLKDDGSAGGWTFWVLGSDLQVRWSKNLQLPPMGHHLHICDINNDGREEILAGYHCYTGTGDLVWRVEEARYWDMVNGARHPDALLAGPLWPGTMRVVYVSGGEGVVLVDGLSGEVINKQRIGHAQGVNVGKFVSDMPGHQIVVGTRHQNYGILCFLDGEGQVIGRFQPDYLSQGGPPINWHGDGTEYILLHSSAAVFGLWDRQGNYLVDCKELDLFDGIAADVKMAQVAMPVDICGDPRDELALMYDGRLIVYTQDRAYEGAQIFAPQRNECILTPRFSYERWVDNDVPHPGG